MPLTPPITHVIFDMDGVLLDTEPKYTIVYQTILARFGHEFNWDIKSKIMGRVAPESANIIVNHYSLPISPSEFAREREALLEQLLPSAEPIPGAYELTMALKARSIPIAVATSSESHAYKLKTQKHQEWFNTFNFVITGDNQNVKKGKPAPDIYLYAAKCLGAQPSTCLVFEDAPSGITAAKSAGMQVIGLYHPMMDKALFNQADLLINENFTHFNLPW